MTEAKHVAHNSNSFNLSVNLDLVEMAATDTIYSLEQVAGHNQPDDAWIVIRGEVFNVSSYFDEHPGGRMVLEEVAGTDATEDFEYLDHSNDARRIMRKFKVGDLPDAEKARYKSFAKSAIQQAANHLRVRVPAKPNNWRLFFVGVLAVSMLVLLVVQFDTIRRFFAPGESGYTAPEGSSGFWVGIATASTSLTRLFPTLRSHLNHYKPLEGKLDALVTMSGLPNVYFLGLSAGGFDSLWGTLRRTGAAQALGTIKATGTLPSGDQLIKAYTGVSWLDKLLLSPVIFYDSLMYTRHPVHRALLVSVFSSMQATGFAMLVNSAEGSSFTWSSLLEHAAWGVFNQSYGAAFVYPLYCLLHVSRSSNTRGLTSSTPLRDSTQAEALVYTSVLFALTPLWLLYPAFINCSSETRHILIASYRASPLILAISQPVIASALRSIRKWKGRTLLSERPEVLMRWSLHIAAASSALGHSYAILTALLSPGASLAGVFSPYANVTQTDLGQTSSVLRRGAHLFLQNDLIVIAAALVPFATLMFTSKDKTTKDEHDDPKGVTEWLRRLVTLDGARRFIVWTGVAVLASPGAVFPLALASVFG
ncbi:hypothetical protein CC79DRAFT_1359670 [Sarocladium strictum]